MPRTFQNENPSFVIERARRENERRAGEALRTLGLFERNLEEDPASVQERLLDLVVNCCHLVQGSPAHLDLSELVKQAEKVFRIEIEQASRSVIWHDEDQGEEKSPGSQTG